MIYVYEFQCLSYCVHSRNPALKYDFWHIGIVNQSQHPHNFLHSLPKGTKLTKLHCNNSLTDEFIKQFLKAGISECAPSIPTVQKKQLSSVPRKCACYKWYVHNIVIYTTWHKHQYYSVCKLIATVPLKKVGHTWRVALNPRLWQLPTCLEPQDQVTSVLMYISRFWKWFFTYT